MASRRALLHQRTQLLLDGGADGAVERATALVGMPVASLTLRRVHRRSRSTSLAYEAHLQTPDGGTDPVDLVVHTDLDPLPDGAFTVASEAGQVAVWTYPNDPFLPGLPAAADPVRVGQLLAQVGLDHQEVELRRHAYRPGRRAVIEATAGRGARRGSQAFLKLLPSDRIAALSEVHTCLAEHGLPVPRVLGTASDQGILAMTSLPGRTLRRAVIADAALPSAATLVELSRQLSTIELPAGRDPVKRADPRRYVDRLAAAFPERQAHIVDIAEAAAELGPGTAPAQVTVHGDLQPRQLLVTDPGEPRGHEGRTMSGAGELTGLLDLDGAGPGDLASDAGNLVVYLQATSDRHPAAGQRSERYARTVHESYLDLVPAEQLARAQAAAWLGLATGALRHATDGAHDLAAHRIDRAAHALAAQ